ncbi:MAG TPA: AAA family ATPase [Phycisphaerae bacterium]|nr:AAA family ATPase [Phycisphaerae bacterium]
MRLEKITIRKFKGIRELELIIPRTDENREGSADFISIVGENNCCKSSILEAICLACPEVEPSQPTIDHFHMRDEANGPIEVEFEFGEVTEDDAKKRAIGPHVYNDKYIVRKKWSEADSRAIYEAKAPTVIYKNLPSPLTKQEQLKALPPEWKEVFETVKAKNPAAKNPALVQEMKTFALENKKELIEQGAPQWDTNPGGISPNLDSVLPRVIYVPAIRETNEEAAVSKRGSAIRQIVNTMFEEDLEGHEVIEAFKDAADRVKELFDEVGKHAAIRAIEGELTRRLGRLIDLEAIFDFTPPEVSDNLAGKTELWVRDQDIRTRPEHQGHGAQRALILALLELLADRAQRKQADGFKRTILLLIEEPEIYLHPSMCRKMRDVLLRIARLQTAQVICTTHSPVFLDLADRHDGIVILRRTSHGIEKVQRMADIFPGKELEEERSRLRMILNFDPSANEVFFTRKVCLVEGDCELAAINACGRRLADLKLISWEKFLLARRSVTVVNCRGKWTILPFQRVLNEFGVPYRIIHDEDKGAPAAANQKIISLLGNDEKRRIIHKPNFEQGIFSTVWTEDKPWRASQTILELTATNFPDSLKTFLEFVLDVKLDALKPEPENLAQAAQPQVQRPRHQKPVRRNERERIRKIAATAFGEPAQLNPQEYFGIAAGPFRLIDVSGLPKECTLDGEGRVVLATIRGESMANTLYDGDTAVLKKLDNVFLEPVEDIAAQTPFDNFRRSVQNGIYLVAVNDSIDNLAYTLKRVISQEQPDGSWICRICADNPEVRFGDRGQMLVRRTDRVHFAAKLIGIVEAVPNEGPTNGQ